MSVEYLMNHDTTLNQHGDRICDMIQVGTDISTVSNAMKYFTDKANKELNMIGKVNLSSMSLQKIILH